MKSNLKINCDVCSKRPICTDLCDRAREYANQDLVPQREKTLGRPIVYSTWGPWNRYQVEDGLVLNDRQLCVFVLLSSGVPQATVKKGMGINRVTFDNIARAINKVRKARKD